MRATTPIKDEISVQIAIHRGVIHARWFLIAGLSLLGVLLKVLGNGASALVPTFLQILLLVIVGCAYNTAYVLYIRKKGGHTERALNRLGFLQIAIDTIVITVIIYLAGGIDSSAFLYYVYPIITASQLFRIRGIVFAIVFTTTLYTTLIGLEFFEQIPHRSAYARAYNPNHYQNIQYTFTVVTNVIFSLVLAGIFASVTSSIKKEQTHIKKIERDRMGAILESLDDAIMLVDNDNRLILANKAAERMLSMPREHMLNVTMNKKSIKKIPNSENLLELFYPVSLQKNPVLNKKYTVVFEKPLRMILEVITIPVSDEHGNVIGYLKDLHDITREKEIDRMKSEFISIAAHQLRTPLSAVKWSLRVVLDGDVGKVSREMHALVTKTYSTNERMIRLVNDLLNVSRIEEGRFKYVYEELDLVSFLDSTVQELRQAAKENSKKIVWRRQKKLLKILGDEDRLRLAIVNLLDNALKYTVHNGRVTITAEETDDKRVKITITDNGMGIPADEQYRLFTKFYRGSNAIKQQTEGSGLGLFIAKNIIDKHGGDISCVSTEGKGTTFYVYLPIKPPLRKQVVETSLLSAV